MKKFAVFLTVLSAAGLSIPEPVMAAPPSETMQASSDLGTAAKQRREWNRNRRWNRGRHNGWRNRRVCTVRWQHHRRVRVCRVIRVRTRW